MPQQSWGEKRERQYEHVKESAEQQGRSEDTAEEIAARTVNKTRAQQGEADTASQSSVEDLSPSTRGGEHSHEGPQGRTKEQLYEDAKREHVEGRSKMDKDELRDAVKRKEDR
jgi:hypothetical protein